MKNTYRILLLVISMVGGAGENLRAGDTEKIESIQVEIKSLEQICSEIKPLLIETGHKVVRLRMSDCLQRALANNLDVRVGEYEPAIRAEDVISAEAAFDTVLFASGQFDLTDRANIDSTYFERTIVTDSGTQVQRVATTPFDNIHDYNYVLGLRKLLPTGGTVQVAEQLRRYRDLNNQDLYYRNPFYEFGLQLQLRHPLLRDFGIDVNRASIQASRNNYQVSRQQLHQLLIRVAAEVESNYWNLYAARQRVKIVQILVNSAQSSLKRIQQRQGYDGESLNIERTQAVIERARANLVISQNIVMQRQELLLQSLNDPNLALDYKWEIIPTDRPSQEFFELDYEKAVQVAGESRPEIIAQRHRLDTAGIAEMVAENQRLPRLDLLYSQEITGAGDQYHSSWDQQWRNETTNYLIGLSFEYPLRNRAQDAAYHRAQKQRQQEDLSLQNIREQVLTDLNNAVHNLKYRFKEISVREQAAQAEQNVLLTHLAIEESGRQDSMRPEFLNLKLNSDERLANARIEAVQTLIEYNLAIMNVQRAQGILLRYNEIDFDKIP